MYEATVTEILSQPLFFCGLYFVTVNVCYEGGINGSRKIMFEKKEDAQNLAVGHKVIL